jgi:hypothetical protein
MNVQETIRALRIGIRDSSVAAKERLGMAVYLVRLGDRITAKGVTYDLAVDPKVYIRDREFAVAVLWGMGCRDEAAKACQAIWNESEVAKMSGLDREKLWGVWDRIWRGESLPSNHDNLFTLAPRMAIVAEDDSGNPTPM